jgi:ankyrin repeat protein
MNKAPAQDTLPKPKGAEQAENINQALVAASQSGDAGQVASLLLLEGIEVDYCKLGEDFSPLGYAAHNGHTAVVKLLLNAGADVLNTDDSYYTPLHSSLCRGHDDIVQMLLGPSAKAKDKEERTVLHWMAAADGSIVHLRKVLEAGCDPSVKDGEGRLAWEWAAEEGGDDCDAAVLLRDAAMEVGERE